MPQTKGALQTLYYFGSPIVALRKSSWAKATNTAWRILGLSNGLAVLVEAEGVLVAGRIASSTSLMFLSLREQRQQVVAGRLDHVDLAVLEGGDLGLHVGIADPLDPVDLDHLAAGQARGRLGARLVLGVLDVDDLLAGLPFVGLEDERAGADHVLDLDLRASGSVSAVFFGIMKGTFDDGLPSDCSTRPYGSFIFILKVLASTDLEAGDRAHHLLAHRIAWPPSA